MRLPRQLIRRWVTRSRLLAFPSETATLWDRLGYLPNLVKPRSFNEKVAVRKLRPMPSWWSQVADKVGVRTYVAERVGEHVLNEVYHVTDDPKTIDLTALPNRFVVKASHGSGWNLFVPDKHQITQAELHDRCAEWLSMRYGRPTLEAHYEAIPPRILVERFLEDSTYGIPLDFKFWVFHGFVRFVQVDFDRFSGHTRTFFDAQWRHQSWGVQKPLGPDLARPQLSDEMIEIAQRLAAGFDFVRVDLYSVNDEQIVFGELTLTPGSGRERFLPSKQVDFWVGSFW